MKDRLKHLEEAYLRENMKETVLSYPPKWVTIWISGYCTNKCLFCAYHADSAMKDSKVYKTRYNMDMDFFKKTVDMCKDGFVPAVHICGSGEPLLNPKAFDMIDYAAEVYGTTSLHTNFHEGLFTKKNLLKKLISRGKKLRYIATDFMSGNKEQHEKIKSGSSYDYAMKSLAEISQNSETEVYIYYILTKYNYSTLIELAENLKKRGVRKCLIQVSNLMSYDFDEYTASSSVYTSGDVEITGELKKAKEASRSLGYHMNIPEPADKLLQDCSVFWQKFQICPVNWDNSEHCRGNVIPHTCRAVVLGSLDSLGYLGDYSSIMELWNNEKLVRIRQNLINGTYPDKECVSCLFCKSSI